MPSALSRPPPWRIYVYSPSGAVSERPRFARAIRRLRALGHSVEIDPDALARHQRFAGDDATRLAAIARAARSGADLALPTRGGYGLTRLLAYLPYPALAHAAATGTHFVGLSDFTALQLALLAQTGAVTWAGPLLLGDFDSLDAPDDIMLACLDDVLSGRGEGVGWRMSKKDASDADWHIDSAPLWGGNLSVLVSLLGTPYFPNVAGGILFLEDVGEHPYRIERMLTQLLHAGVLARQRALLLGRFTGFTLSAHDKGFGLQKVFDWLRSQTPCPLLPGLPHGHVPTKVLLPVGAPVSLSVQGREVLLYWGEHAMAETLAPHH